MALNVTTLRQALLDAFKKGLDEPDWTKEDAAGALADAIDAYVRTAEVVSVNVDVVNPGGNPIGTGTQTGVGALQ